MNVDEISRKNVALKVKMIKPEYTYRYILELILQLIFVPVGCSGRRYRRAVAVVTNK